MVCLPILQEASALGNSASKLLTGDVQAARRVWTEYADESVIGSGITAVSAGINGDSATAKRRAKGCGRAFGRSLSGGGLLCNVPVFKELDKCGKSLGDVIGGGDMESASKRWTVELIQEYKDPNLWAKGVVDVAVTGATITVGLVTGGAGSVPVAAGMGALMGASSGLINNAAHQVIDMTIESNRVDAFGEKSIPKRTHLCVSEMVGSSLTAAVAGAAAGAFVKSAEGWSAEGLRDCPDALEGFRTRVSKAPIVAEAAVQSLSSSKSDEHALITELVRCRQTCRSSRPREGAHGGFSCISVRQKSSSTWC